MLAEQLAFLKSWMADPLRIAAIAPSSQGLARLITNEVTARHAPVLELGAGTGVFTRQLILRGIPESKLAVIEYMEAFAVELKRMHPAARVLQMDASDLEDVELFGEQKVGAVISGLPLLSFPPHATTAILRGAFAHLHESGGFFQFTYGPRCPVSKRVLESLGLQAERIGWCLANLPPAAVYRITRKQIDLDLPGRPHRARCAMPGLQPAMAAPMETSANLTGSIALRGLSSMLFGLYGLKNNGLALRITTSLALMLACMRFMRIRLKP